MPIRRGRRINNIWRVPAGLAGLAGLNRPATWDDAEKLTFDQALIDFIDVTPDGSLLLFDSDRSGNPDLWTMTLATRELKRLTSHPAQDWAPRLSPDGKDVAFYSTRSGNREVWVAPFDGAARQLTDYEGLDCCPAWSPMGNELTYMSGRPTAPPGKSFECQAGVGNHGISTPLRPPLGSRSGRWGVSS